MIEKLLNCITVHKPFDSGYTIDNVTLLFKFLGYYIYAFTIPYFGKSLENDFNKDVFIALSKDEYHKGDCIEFWRFTDHFLRMRVIRHCFYLKLS